MNYFLCKSVWTNKLLVIWLTEWHMSKSLSLFTLLYSFYFHSILLYIPPNIFLDRCVLSDVHVEEFIQLCYVKWNTICDKWADLIFVVKQYIKVTTLLNQPLASRFRLYPIVSNMHLSVRNDGGGRRSVLCLQREEMANNEWMHEWIQFDE